MWIALNILISEKRESKANHLEHTFPMRARLGQLPPNWSGRISNAETYVGSEYVDSSSSLSRRAPLKHTALNVPLTELKQAGGLAFNFYAAFFEMTLVLGHPDVPISAHYVHELLQARVITAMLSPPVILEELSKDHHSISELAMLKHVAYGGGPLHPDAGKVLAAELQHLFSYIGATEYGWFHLISGGTDRWDCLKFFDTIGYRFDEVSDGSFELVILKDSRTDKFHGIFEVFPDLSEYRTKDLYEPRGGGWRHYKGRTDDLIVLSNGEKINPTTMELAVQSHPIVKAALVVGNRRFKPSLLVELDHDSVPRTEAERRERVEQIWPSVEEANKLAPNFAKIPKALVLFATAEKPFLRAGKGTV